MVAGNGGEKPLYRGKAKNVHSARSSSSGQKKLQAQFDAWMNNLNIAKVPESVCKEMLEKGKGKAASDSAGAKVKTLKNSNPRITIPDSHAIQQLGSSAKITQSSSAIKLVVLPVTTYQPAQQAQSNASSGTCADKIGNSAQKGIPQDYNHVTANFAEKTSVDLNQMQNTPSSNMSYNNYGNKNKGGNHEGSNGNNDNDNDNDNIDDIDDDVMIISPPHPVQNTASTLGNCCDLNEVFPPLDRFGDDVPLTQKIQETPIWEWDHLYFP